MRAKEFVIEALKELLGKVTTVKVRYEFDANALVHVIEVLPNEVYSSNKEYLGWEEQLYHDFVKQFPRENICFITDDALVGIKNAEFEQQGENYCGMMPTVYRSENKLLFTTFVAYNNYSRVQPLNCYEWINKQSVSIAEELPKNSEELLKAA